MPVTCSVLNSDALDPNAATTGEWQLHAPSFSHRFRVSFSPVTCFVTASVFTKFGFGPPLGALSPSPGLIEFYAGGLVDGEKVSIEATAWDFSDVASDVVKKTTVRRPMIPPPSPHELPPMQRPMYQGEAPKSAKKKKKKKKKK